MKRSSTLRLSSSSLLDSEVLWPSYYMANKPSDGIPLSSIVELAEEKHVADIC